MQPLKLTITNYPDLPDTKLISFEGDFDGYAKETLIELQNTVEKAGVGSTLIFEFSQLKYLNSFAIGEIIAWKNIMTKKQGEIIIVGSNKNIQDIFSVLGIGETFKHYADLDTLKKSTLNK